VSNFVESTKSVRLECQYALWRILSAPRSGHWDLFCEILKASVWSNVQHSMDLLASQSRNCPTSTFGYPHVCNMEKVEQCWTYLDVRGIGDNAAVPSSKKRFTWPYSAKKRPGLWQDLCATFEKVLASSPTSRSTPQTPLKSANICSPTGWVHRNAFLHFSQLFKNFQHPGFQQHRGKASTNHLANV